MMVVLESDRLALRRDHLYLSADPSRSALTFSANEVGPWEQFTIVSARGDTPTEPSWRSLPHIPKSFIPPLSGTAAEFRRRARAKFVVAEEEYIHAPITVSDEHLNAFRQGLIYNFPAEFGELYLSKCSINKLNSKYVILSNPSCGIIFDKSRFWTDPSSICYEAQNKYARSDDNNYEINFSYLDQIVEENISALVFYDANYNNYFHWWAECLANLELAELCLGAVPPMIIWNGKPELSAWQRASLDILGVDVIHRMTTDSDVVRVKEAMWFYRETGYVPGLLLRRLRARALKQVSTPISKTKKLFIRRKHHRNIKNDRAIEIMLSNLGYETICTEDFLQIDQIKIFSSAQAVVATHGAGLTNMLFMPPGSTVIELMPHLEARPFYWMMAQKLHHRYAVLMCTAVDGHFNGSIEVDLSDLNRLITLMDESVTPVSGIAE